MIIGNLIIISLSNIGITNVYNKYQMQPLLTMNIDNSVLVCVRVAPDTLVSIDKMVSSKIAMNRSDAVRILLREGLKGVSQ